jgi:hypothetical protein
MLLLATPNDGYLRAPRTMHFNFGWTRQENPPTLNEMRG